MATTETERKCYLDVESLSDEATQELLTAVKALDKQMILDFTRIGKESDRLVLYLRAIPHYTKGTIRAATHTPEMDRVDELICKHVTSDFDVAIIFKGTIGRHQDSTIFDRNTQVINLGHVRFKVGYSIGPQEVDLMPGDIVSFNGRGTHFTKTLEGYEGEERYGISLFKLFIPKN